jgi:hypothetical protein
MVIDFHGSVCGKVSTREAEVDTAAAPQFFTHDMGALVILHVRCAAPELGPDNQR